MAAQMYLINPKKRRKSRKARSPAQKAAFRKMIAARRGSGHVAANPRRRRRSVARAATHRRVRRNPLFSLKRTRRSARRSYRRNPVGGISGMLKSGAMGGAGAVLNDILFGQAVKFLPPSMVSPLNTDGTTNWMYFAAKAAGAVAIGTLGEKVLPPAMAEKFADGALTVLSWQILRGFVGTTGLALGAYVPTNVNAPRRLSGMSAYARLGVSDQGAGPGAMAAKRAQLSSVGR